MPKVSVIIPVYNTAPYLRRCLDSVIRQTLQDIEIICVDDGSTDGSADILREYAKRDNRIRLVPLPENMGASVARNRGMAAAMGEYLGFVDSDDAIDLHFYESLYNKAAATDSLITRTELKLIDLLGKETMLLKNKEIQDDGLNFSHFSTGIYHTAFIRNNGICFPVGIANGEDWAFLVKAVSLVSSVETVDGALYYYYKRSDSADLQKWTTRHLEFVYLALEDIFSFLNARNIDENNYAKICTYYIWKCLTLRNQLDLSDRQTHVLSAEWAIRLYKMCIHQEAINNLLLSSETYCAKLVIAGELEMLIEFLSQDISGAQLSTAARRTQREMLFCALRSRVMGT